VSFERTRVPLGSPIEAAYRFTVANDAPAFDRDYVVFVHFVDADGEVMWTDDHAPSVPTTEWKPGQTIQYTRTSFAPIYPYVGPATVEVGLYSPSDRRRLRLAGVEREPGAYKVLDLEILPQSENVFLIYKDGWHRPEVAPDEANLEWQWSRKQGVLTFRNPRRDSVLYLKLDGRPDLFPESGQQVNILAGDQVVDSFALTSSEAMLRKATLTAAQLGEGDMVELKIEVDKTFVPASTPGGNASDTRELGVRVYNAFVAPR
jgi:hypothetical protein